MGQTAKESSDSFATDSDTVLAKTDTLQPQAIMAAVRSLQMALRRDGMLCVG
jgi:hypothetical protein